MRKIGQANTPKDAQTVRWYLYSQNIQCRSLGDPEEQDLDIWVYSEDDIIRAKEMLRHVMEDPSNPYFSNLAEEGKKKLAVKTLADNVRKVEFRNKSKPLGEGKPIITFGLIGVCCFLFLAHFLGRSFSIMELLSISQDHLGNFVGVKSFYEIRHGEVWRLFTPIFIHKDIFHLLFNMLWLYQLAVPIEDRSRGIKLLLLIAAIAIPSNIAYYIVAGPAFGGMSGVIYGLAGYLWVCSKDSRSPYQFYDDNLFRFFMIWYVLCWILSAIGMRVANTVHGFGALMGILAGWIACGGLSRLRGKRLSQVLTRENILNFLIGVSLLFGGIFTDILTY